MMKKPKIALKPYLDTISGYCDTLSNEELTNIIIGLAKDVSTMPIRLLHNSPLTSEVRDCVVARAFVQSLIGR